MIINTIHLHNYRRYHDQLIEFPNGLIGIVGCNGTGKSTLIEAIAWCLYGNVASRTDKEFIKRSSAGDHEECKVVVELVLGEDNLRIERELRGKNSSGTSRLFINGNNRPEVSGMKDVSEYISKRTGMDHVAFITSIFAEQKELNALSSMDPAERKRILMKLLRVDKIDSVIAQIRADKRDSESKIAVLKPTLKNLDEIIQEGIKLKHDKVNKGIDVKSTTRLCSTLKKVAEDKKKNFVINESKLKANNELEKLLEKFTSTIKSKNEEKATTDIDLEEANRSQVTLEKLLPQLSKFERTELEKNRLDSLEVKFVEKKSVEEQLKRMESLMKEKISKYLKKEREFKASKDPSLNLAEERRRIRELRKEKQEREAIANRLGQKISDYEKRIIKVKADFSRIKHLGKDGECPMCNRQLGTHLSEILTHFTDELTSINKDVKVANKERKKYLEDIKKIVTKIKTSEKAEVDIQKRIENRTKLRTILIEGKKELKNATKQLKILKSKLEKYSVIEYDESVHQTINVEFLRLKPIKDKSIRLETKAKRISILQKRTRRLSIIVTKLNNSISDCNEKIKKLDFNKHIYEASKRSREKANNDYSKKRELLIQLKSLVKQINTAIDQNVRTLQEERQKKKTIAEEEEKIISRSKLEKIMIDFRTDLISRIKPVLASRASDLFRQVTKGRYSSLDLDEDYNIMIEDGGERFAIDRFSGGEEDLANLCLRIAISQEISERSGGNAANLIALDEIFGSQDTDRKSSILKALSELANQFKQILLITHIEDVKESLPFVLNIKDNGDGVTVVESEGAPFRIPI